MTDSRNENNEKDKDQFLVELDANHDPKQWARKKKWSTTVIVSLVTFVSPVASAIAAPADANIVKELGITSSVISQMTISIFLLGYAVAPLILAPMSELYGRKPVIILSNLFFLAFNLGCGFSKTTTQLLICRFFAGIGGSVPQSVGGGTLSDMWATEERGKAFSVYSLGPVLGPAMGPIAGGFIAMKSTWRWAFWATTILAAVVATIIFFFFDETYAPRLLRIKSAKMRKEMDDMRYYSKFDNAAEKKFTQILITNLVRPLRFFVTQPIILFMAMYMAFLYGTLYLLITTYPTLWAEEYHQSQGIGGLHYISISVGSLIAAQVGSRLLDTIYRRLKKRNNNIGMPEFRVPLMLISGVAFPSGIFIYGWCAYYKTHWIGPDFGMGVASLGIMLAFNPIQIYIVDSYGQYAASAMACVTMTRALCGFALPLAGPKMYQSLGYGWGNSVLGFIALGFGVPIPLVLWFKGAVIRRASKFAVKV